MLTPWRAGTYFSWPPSPLLPELTRGASATAATATEPDTAKADRYAAAGATAISGAQGARCLEGGPENHEGPTGAFSGEA